MVGVAVASIAEGQNLNFAIPSSYLAALLKHMGEPRSFSSEKELQGDGGWDARVLGTKNTHGVAGVAFLWEDGSIAKYTYGELSDDKVTRLKRRHFSFTFQNRLQTAVTDVHFVVVFFGSDGEVVDSFEGLTCPGRTILPMLAKRQVEAYWSSLDAGGSSICSSNVRKSAPICTLIGCSEIRGTLWKEWRRRRDSNPPSAGTVPSGALHITNLHVDSEFVIVAEINEVVAAVAGACGTTQALSMDRKHIRLPANRHVRIIDRGLDGIHREI